MSTRALNGWISALVLAALGLGLLVAGAALAQDPTPQPPAVLASWWADGRSWVAGHPLETLGLLLYALINVANRLAAYPRAAGARAVLLVLIDWLSFVPHRDSPGLFTVPLLARSTPPDLAEPMTLKRAAGGD